MLPKSENLRWLLYFLSSQVPALSEAVFGAGPCELVVAERSCPAETEHFSERFITVLDVYFRNASSVCPHCLAVV